MPARLAASFTVSTATSEAFFGADLNGRILLKVDPQGRFGTG
jgi:hypothetical protein